MLFVAVSIPVITFAQETADIAKEKSILAISEKACECTMKINTNQVRDSIVSKINSCITAEIMQEQMKGMLDNMGKLVDEAVEAKNDTTVGQNINYQIIVDKDFEEIQQYMVNNCKAVSILMSSNDMLSKRSMSKNKKALAYYEEGIRYAQKEQYDMAIVSYNRAVKADSKFAFAWDNMGICYRRTGKYNEAIKCYAKSLEIDPMGKMPLQNTAIAYEFLKDYKKASATYDRFIRTHPNDPEGYYGAGRAYYYAGDYEKGIDNLFKAYKMYAEIKSPYLNDAQSALATFYKDLKDKGREDILIEAANKNGIELN